MKIRYIGKGTKDENWHIEWTSKRKIFRLGCFKAITAGWENWKLRINYNIWNRMIWIFSRFMWFTKKIEGKQYRFFCLAFGWIYQSNFKESQ